MIDFRYHLISIIAVLLALSIGIVTGSGFLGGPLLDRIEGRVKSLERDNAGFKEQLLAVQAEARASDEALRTFGPRIVGGQLVGDSVVVVRFDGADEALAEGIPAIIDEAGGTVTATITLTTKFALEDASQAEELAGVLGSLETEASQLRDATGAMMGKEAAAAAAQAKPGAELRLDRLLAELEALDYAAVERASQGSTVGFGSHFVILGGSGDQSPFPAAEIALPLAEELSQELAVVVAEPAGSTWELTQAVREDAEAQTTVWTVGNADEVLGQIATALTLARGESRPAEHYGDDSVGAAFPEPTPS
ncbi:MAG: copper transporter [Actinobacteria bacterium]|nr:copper transporter [Actinomycetota bacterium]